MDDVGLVPGRLPADQLLLGAKSNGELNQESVGPIRRSKLHL